jgi:hypothetical protein
MKTRETVLLCAAAIVMYSATSFVRGSTRENPWCCVDDGGCTAGYECVTGGDTCDPSLPGRCMPKPEATTSMRLRE